MSQPFPLDVHALIKVLDRLNLGVYITDTEREIMLWNRKAEEITGHRAENVVGSRCYDNILNHIDKDGHPLCTTSLCPLFRAMSLGRESREPILVYARKPDGSRVAVSVSAAPLRNDEGDVVGAIETFRDETARIRDLELAATIQRHILPASMPETPAFEFDVRYYPHALVGGDFYNVWHVGEETYGLLVADVQGHGVSAALYTMVLKSLAENNAHLAADPGAFLSGINRQLAEFLVPGGFASAFYVVINSKSTEVICASAGHPPPLLLSAGGEVQELSAGGMLLGIIPTTEYTTRSAPFTPGDALLCFTDGATEVFDSRKEILGSSGLAEILKAEAEKDKHNLLERIYRKVLDYCGEVTLSDDLLLLSVTRR